MSLRTRLIVAFLLLSVLPLSAVTLYSYSTSVHAFQRAVEREAAQSASDIGHRMAMVTDDLGRRMDRMFQQPTGSNSAGSPETFEQMQAQVAPMLGDAAALVDRVEFDPMPSPPAEPTMGAVPSPPAPAPAPRSRQSIVVDVGAILEQTRKRIDATGLIPPEAQAEMKAEMAKAMRDSIDAHIANTEAMKAAAAMSSVPVPPVVVKMEGHEIAIPVRRHGRELGHARAHLNMDRTLNAVLTLGAVGPGRDPFRDRSRRRAVHTGSCSARDTRVPGRDAARRR